MNDSNVVMPVAKVLADVQKLTIRPLPDPKLIRFPTGAETVAKVLADVQKLTIRPLPDPKLVADLVLTMLGTTLLVPEEAATDGGLAGAVAAPKLPLLPGLANPWQQVRYWEVKDWLAFVAFVLAIVSTVLALRPPAGLIRADVEDIIRTVQESARTASTTSCTNSPSTTVSPSSTRPTNSTIPSSHGEHDHAPTERPPPSSRSG